MDDIYVLTDNFLSLLTVFLSFSLPSFIAVLIEFIVTATDITREIRTKQEKTIKHLKLFVSFILLLGLYIFSEFLIRIMLKAELNQFEQMINSGKLDSSLSLLENINKNYGLFTKILDGLIWGMRVTTGISFISLLSITIIKISNCVKQNKTNKITKNKHK
ncbi:MAG TPA: hypothetical protein GXX60_01540 [Anaerolineaceae bacterium]|nr:hypothetical protein [Anaerolineaceae bacterium]